MLKGGAAMQMISENMGLVDVGDFASVKGNILSSHIAIDIYVMHIFLISYIIIQVIHPVQWY